MAETVAEPQAAAANEKVKLAEASNGAESNSTTVDANGKSDAAVTGDKKVHEDEDNFERYGSEKRERRDGRDSKKRDHDERDRRGRNDRGRGRGRGRGGGRGRGQGRGGRGDYDNRNNRKENVRTRYERQDESSDAAEIRRQVEFYFSDSNLPIDKYLLEETGGPENKPFPLKNIHSFKRMRHFQPFSAVVEAVKGSDFLLVNENDEVYRKDPLPSKFSTDVKKNSDLLTTDTMLRSIYAKGFGTEKESTAFDIEEFFAPYGAKVVRLRRHADGNFKGSCFIEFDSEDTAKQFLEMEDKPKFEDQELSIMSKKEYVDMKTEGILDGSVKPRSPTRYSNSRGRGGRSNDRNGGHSKRKREQDGEDDNVSGADWRERRKRFQQGDDKEESGRDDKTRKVEQEDGAEAKQEASIENGGAAKEDGSKEDPAKEAETEKASE